MLTDPFTPSHYFVVVCLLEVVFTVLSLLSSFASYEHFSVLVFFALSYSNLLVAKYNMLEEEVKQFQEVTQLDKQEIVKKIDIIKVGGPKMSPILEY